MACEISAADELLLTEMIFSGVFNNLTSEQAAALLSCFVFEEKVSMQKLPDELSGCLRTMQVNFRRQKVISASIFWVRLSTVSSIESSFGHFYGVFMGFEGFSFSCTKTNEASLALLSS